jgi:YceI-like domain
MALAPGSHALGPSQGTLRVRTTRGGAVAKAGHDLLIEVGRWQATLTVGDAVAIELTADPRSLRVLEGSGGMMALGDDDKTGIASTIDSEVLQGRAIAFRSVAVAIAGAELHVDGELELAGRRQPLAFALTLDEAAGRLAGSAAVKQSDWKIKPFSALFGTLKVADVVEVAVDVRVPLAAPAHSSRTGERHDG